MVDSSAFGRGLLTISILFLSGCAAVPPDLGRSDVDKLVAERGQDGSAALAAEASAELITRLTSEPLTPESAVRIALINNPELAATYATLGFGAADVYQAGRIRNPVFSASVLNSSLAFEQDQLTFGLAASFTDLITLSARKRLSAAAFISLKQSIGGEVLRIAAEAEMNYYRYVGARQVAALRKQAAKAAGLSATLAGRYYDAGNISAREMAMELAAASEARLQALSAEADEFTARTSLANVLGLSVGEAWQAPAQLELPPGNEDDLDTLLDLARKSRLDLASARGYAAVLADRAGVVNWTRWLGELELGVEREREASGSYLTGPTVSWELPIFNQHEDELLRANAELHIAVLDVRRLTMEVDNSVQLSYTALQNARARVQEHRDVLIPQRVEAVEQAQKEVSFMLIGVFELINVKQAEYDAYQGYLESIRDYWLDRVGLRLAAGNALPSDAKRERNPVDVEMLTRPAPSGMDHGGGGAMHDHSQMQGKDDTEAGQMNHAGHDMMEKENVEPESSDHSGHMMKETENTKAPDSDHSGHTMQNSDNPDTETAEDNGGSR